MQTIALTILLIRRTDFSVNLEAAQVSPVFRVTLRRSAPSINGSDLLAAEWSFLGSSDGKGG